MADLFGFFKRTVTSSYLGIDIGTTSIKIAEVRPGDRLPRLVNYGMLESQSSLARPTTAFQTSTLKLFDQEVIELVQSLLRSMKPSTTLVSASLPLFSSFSTVLTFPEMSPDELEKTIAYQAKQYIPMPLSEVAVDWTKIGEYEDEKGFKYNQILLTSVPQEQIKKYQAIFKAAGLTLRTLEVESLSLIRALATTDPTPTFIVDIGTRSTGIIVVQGGTLRLSRQTDFSGSSLTQALSSSLHINPLRAEELKKERGIVGTGANYELSTIMLPFLDAIISEVKRTAFDYQAQFPGAPKIERAILAGGGSNLLGIERYMKDQLGMPVVKGAPFAKFEYPSSIEPLIPELSGPMSVALGLALKPFLPT